MFIDWRGQQRVFGGYGYRIGFILPNGVWGVSSFAAWNDEDAKEKFLDMKPDCIIRYIANEGNKVYIYADNEESQDE